MTELIIVLTAIVLFMIWLNWRLNSITKKDSNTFRKALLAASDKFSEDMEHDIMEIYKVYGRIDPTLLERFISNEVIKNEYV